jgi:hypothetical protein
VQDAPRIVRVSKHSGPAGAAWARRWACDEMRVFCPANRFLQNSKLLCFKPS